MGTRAKLPALECELLRRRQRQSPAWPVSIPLRAQPRRHAAEGRGDDGTWILYRYVRRYFRTFWPAPGGVWNTVLGRDAEGTVTPALKRAAGRARHLHAQSPSWLQSGEHAKPNSVGTVGQGLWLLHGPIWG
jgi:hypothetical protein